MKSSFLLFVFLLVVVTGETSAQWTNNGALNTAVATGKSDRYDVYSIADGSGNTYVTWYDESSDTKGGVYVQKISSSGSLSWGAGGVRVDSIPQTFEKPSLALDGTGGVFVTWADSRSDNTLPNIYGQHVSSAGATQWAANGINLTAGFTTGISFREPGNPQLLSDGSNGMYLAWDDAFGLVLMRVGSNGTMAWSAKADSVYGATDTRIASDGAGGVILTWTDDRNVGTGDLADIYAQRVNSSGAILWSTGDVVVSSATNLQEYPQIVPDGSGGAVIAWQDFRDGAHFRGYAQKLNSSGVVQWTANGVALTSTTNSINALLMTSDQAGGGIFSWEESRGGGIGGSDNIYAQRLNGTGQRQWSDTGAYVCTNTAPQEDPVIVSDGSSGAIVVWDDNRNTGANIDIYAQRLNAAGVAQWTTDGIPVSTAAGNQERPFIVPASSGAAVVFWYDYRSVVGNSNAEIYAQYVSGNGKLSGVRINKSSVPEAFQLLQNFPNPFNPSTQIHFSIARAGFVSLKIYDMLGREVATLVNQELEPSSYSVTWNASNAASGAYFYRLQSGSTVETRKLLLVK